VKKTFPQRVAEVPASNQDKSGRNVQPELQTGGTVVRTKDGGWFLDDRSVSYPLYGK